MARRKSVPVNPDVVAWAVAQSGFTASELADKVKASPEELAAWLQGDTMPSKTQFNALVRVLKRPSSLFFLPRPPDSFAIPEEYRHDPGDQGRALSPEELTEIRRTRRVQRLLRELRQVGGDEPIYIPTVERRTPAESAAEVARQLLNVSMDEQLSWDSDRQAFDEWRLAFADVGIPIFQAQLGPAGIRGFSLWDDFAPVIAVNTNYNYAARIFTAFHEFGHLLRRRFSACVDLEYGDNSTTITLERWCEAFAAACLLPREDVEYFVIRLSQTDRFELAESVADAFNTSIRAAAIRLVRLNLVDGAGFLSEVNERARVWDRDKGFARGTPPDRIQRRILTYGDALLRPVIEAFDSGRVSEIQIRRTLGLGGSEIADLATRLDTSAA